MTGHVVNVQYCGPDSNDVNLLLSLPLKLPHYDGICYIIIIIIIITVVVVRSFSRTRR